jgi:hypothetical protein
MEQLLLHLFGDFILQNDSVALRKKERSWTGLLYCIYHCITYSIPFLLITNWKACILIGIGHFLIDRWNIVGYFIKTKNFVKTLENFGHKPERPFAITAWLYIIQDNTIHLIWNFFIIYMFAK